MVVFRRFQLLLGLGVRQGTILRALVQEISVEDEEKTSDILYMSPAIAIR